MVSVETEVEGTQPEVEFEKLVVVELEPGPVTFTVIGEQVDVELIAAGGQVLDGGAELLIASVHNQVANHLAQHGAGDGHGRPGDLTS